MSREDVEVVRAVYDATARRDPAGVLALYDADVEWDMSRVPEASLAGYGVLRGHEALRHAFRDWYAAWERVEDECEELIDAGEYVVSVVTRRGRGRASGVEVHARRAGVWTIREGKVARVIWFPSVGEALQAAGLQE